jgi:hypothetical protein
MTVAPRMQQQDPIEMFTDLMDGFTEYVLRTSEQAVESRRYRLNLLWIHSLYALLMGPAFIALGQDGMAGTAWTHLRELPGSPTSIGMLLIVGGFILGVGCIMLNRKIETVGLIFLTAFYLTICVGFGVATVQWYIGAIEGAKPAPYAPILYAHFTTIMGLHFWTLVKIIRRQG